MKDAFIVDQKTKSVTPTKILSGYGALKALTHPIRGRILDELAESPKYPMQIAKKLKLHEQAVYYHIRKLKDEGLVEKSESEVVGAPEFYTVSKTAFSIIPKYVRPLKSAINLHDYLKIPGIFEGFVENQKINCKIVVGAAFPHGSLKRSMKSGFLAGEIGAVVGRYGAITDRVCHTDMDIRDKKDNFIVIGGFHVNTLQHELNKYQPVKFNDNGTKIISTVSGDEYSEPETGFVCRFRNPFDRTKSVIALAGIESSGTRAAVLAFVKYFSRIESGNMYNKNIIAKIVEGVEQNGQIVDVRFVE